jgi:cell division protein FtsB
MRSVILMVLFFLLQANIWIGNSSVFRVQSLYQQVKAQEIKNQHLSDYNIGLRTEINQLRESPESLVKQHPALVEKYARWKLGLAKEDEWLYLW